MCNSYKEIELHATKVIDTGFKIVLNQIMMKRVRSKDFLHIYRKLSLLIRAVKRHDTFFYLSWAREPGVMGLCFSLVLVLMHRNLQTILFYRVWTSCDTSLRCLHVFCHCQTVTLTFHFVLLPAKRPLLCCQPLRLLSILAPNSANGTSYALKIKCRQEANGERFATCVMG